MFIAHISCVCVCHVRWFCLLDKLASDLDGFFGEVLLMIDMKGVSIFSGSLSCFICNW